MYLNENTIWNIFVGHSIHLNHYMALIYHQNCGKFQFKSIKLGLNSFDSVCEMIFTESQWHLIAIWPSFFPVWNHPFAFKKHFCLFFPGGFLSAVTLSCSEHSSYFHESHSFRWSWVPFCLFRCICSFVILFFAFKNIFQQIRAISLDKKCDDESTISTTRTRTE